MSTATRSNAGQLLQSIGADANLSQSPASYLQPTVAAPTTSPATGKQSSPAANHDSPAAMEAFIASRLNSAGSQRMGGKGAKPGFTYRAGAYSGMNTTQAYEQAKNEWMAMHPNEREAWWQQNNPANGRTPSEGGPKGNGFGNLSNPFGKLGSPHAKLAPVSAAPTLSAPVGDMNLLAQVKGDASRGITSRGTDGSVQYANGASITPVQTRGDASMGPPQTTQSRVLSSPYGSGSVVDTGVKGPPGRINWSMTYDPNFFNQQQQTQQQGQQQAQTAPAGGPTDPLRMSAAGNYTFRTGPYKGQTVAQAEASARNDAMQKNGLPTPTSVATQPNPAFSPAYNSLIWQQSTGATSQPATNPATQPYYSNPANVAANVAAIDNARSSQQQTALNRTAAPSPGSFSSPPPTTSDTAMSTAQQAGSMIRAIPGTVAGVTMGGTSGLASGYYGAMTGPARAGYNAGQNGIPQTAGEFSAGLTGASVGAAKSAGSQISSPLGANSPIAQSFADTRKTTPTDNNN